MQVTYRVRQNNRPWTLTVLAGGDLNSGSSTVDISNVTWVATPAPPFQNGTLSKTVAQTLASGTGNVNPAATGSVTFRVGEFMDLHRRHLHADGHLHAERALIGVAIALLAVLPSPGLGADLGRGLAAARGAAAAGPGSTTTQADHR